LKEEEELEMREKEKKRLEKERLKYMDGKDNERQQKIEKILAKLNPDKSNQKQ